MINSLECGDLSPLLFSNALTLESGDKSPHSKELSYLHSIHIRGEAKHERWGKLHFFLHLFLPAAAQRFIESRIRSLPGKHAFSVIRNTWRFRTVSIEPLPVL